MSENSADKRLLDVEDCQREMHEFWFKPPITGGPNRAQQLDSLLGLARSSKFTARFFFWVFGAAVAGASAWQTFKSVFPKLGG